MNIYNPGEAELLLERGKVWKSMPMIGSYFNGLDKQDELNLSILLTNQTKYLLQLNSEQLATIGSSPADILEKVCKEYLELIEKFPKNIYAVPTIATHIEYLNLKNEPTSYALVSERYSKGSNLADNIYTKWQEFYNKDTSKDFSKFYVFILLLQGPVKVENDTKADSWFGKLLYIDESYSPTEKEIKEIKPISDTSVVSDFEIIELS